MTDLTMANFPLTKGTEIFFNSLDFQIEYIKDLAHPDYARDSINNFCNTISGELYRSETDHKPYKILALAEGRSLISLRSFLDRVEGRFENVKTYTSGVRNLKGINLAILNTASGNSDGVVSYLDYIIKSKIPVVLFTEAEKSKSIDALKDYDLKQVVLLCKHPAEKNQDSDYSKESLVAPMGTESELKTFVLFACAFEEIKSRCDNTSSVTDFFSAQERNVFENTLSDLISNAECLTRIDSHAVENWIEQVVPRRGIIVPYGFGNSALVSEAFGMRLVHMKKDVSFIGQPNRPNYLRGDMFCPISGSGDTPEVLREFEKAKRADKAAITTERDSKLANLMRRSENEKNILYIPVLKSKKHLYDDESSKLFSSGKNVLGRPLYFETNLYLVLNAIVAQAAFNEGITLKSMKNTHV